jgi:hypothetical protein
MGENIELTQEQKDYIEKIQHMSKQEQEIEVRKNIIADVKALINVPDDYEIVLETPRHFRGGIGYRILPKEKRVIIRVSNMFNNWFLLYFKYRENFGEECNNAISKAGGW